MNIAMIGSGYVGLVTGACLAEVGHTGACVDVDPEKVRALNTGVIPIFEPGLERIVAGNGAAVGVNIGGGVHQLPEIEPVRICEPDMASDLRLSTGGSLRSSG